MASWRIDWVIVWVVRSDAEDGKRYDCNNAQSAGFRENELALEIRSQWGDSTTWVFPVCIEIYNLPGGMECRVQCIAPTQSDNGSALFDFCVRGCDLRHDRVVRRFPRNAIVRFTLVTTE